MSPKSIVLLVMALGCGLVAAVGINQIMARPTEAVATSSIVVAKREIKKGEPFRPDDVRLQDWPLDTIPEGALDSIEKLKDKHSRFTVFPGEPIIDKKLYGKDDHHSIVVEIPAGHKAMTVKVDNVSGIAGMISPGDNVDLLVHLEKNPAKEIFATTTKPLQRNVKVLAVDDVLERPAAGEPSIPAKTVTLLVTNRQASLITHATEIGTIKLVMRSSKGNGTEEESDDQITTGDVLRGGAPAEPSESTPLASGITPLPPINQSPPVAEKAGGGLGGLMDMLGELKKTRDGGFVEDKPPPFTVVLIEGPESRQIDFDSKPSSDRPTGTGLAVPKSSQLPGVSEPKLDSPTGAAEEPESTNKEAEQAIQSLFKPKAAGRLNGS